MKHVGVDIIIPIFNAYDDVLKCVESVWKWTDLKTHRLVLVNDCSTDTRIMPYLERQKGRGCIVIHNKTSSSISLAWEEPACNANRPPLPIIMAYAIIICLNPFLNRLQIPDLLYQEHQE